MKPKRHSFGIAAGVAASLAMVLAACSPATTGDSSDDSSGSSGGSGNKTTVTFRLWDEAAAPAYEDSFAAFEKQHENIDNAIG